MNWNEIKRKVLDNGFVFVKHGSRHDEYRNPETGRSFRLKDTGIKKSVRG